MTRELALINNREIEVKEIDGNPVLTFKDVDELHERLDGTARKRFHENKERFIETEDYYKICASEIRTNKIMDISNKTHQDVVFLTQTGYLMLVKSFTDDLAWHIQRALVNSYFNRGKQQMVSMEHLKNVQQQYNELKSSILEMVGDVSFIKSQLLKITPAPKYTDWKKEINSKIKALAEATQTTHKDCLHQTYLGFKESGYDLNGMKKQYCEENGIANCTTLDFIESSDDLREGFTLFINNMMTGLNIKTPASIPASVVLSQSSDPIRDTISPLIERYNDTSHGGNVTYRKVYAAMNVGWNNRRTRYKKLHNLKNAPKKITLIENDEKLQKLFKKTVCRMLEE